MTDGLSHDTAGHKNFVDQHLHPTMPSFSLPPINDNPDGSWGPSSSNLPEHGQSSSSRWTALYSKYSWWRTWWRRRDGATVFGSGTASAFAYFHVEDESSFSLVDNKTAAPRRGGGFARGREGTEGTLLGADAAIPEVDEEVLVDEEISISEEGDVEAGGTGRRSFILDPQTGRTRESSVVISPQWSMLEEIEFHRLAKLRLEVDAPEDITPLQLIDRIKYNTTTSDDPVIQQCSDVRSSICVSWDIVIVREGNNLFFDKRDGGPFDTVTVNENASDPPQDPTPPNPNNPTEKAAVPETPSINSATSLSLEATYINQNFSFQAVSENPRLPLLILRTRTLSMGLMKPIPWLRVDIGTAYSTWVSQKMKTSRSVFEPKSTPTRQAKAILVMVKASWGPDWRSKLDSQRGAVVATEMKNNSCKLAKWAVQSVLAGADLMKIGYISRANPRDPSRHVILSTASMRPTDFAGQLGVSLVNGWGIVRTVTDLCMKMPEGKYVLVKDPNKVSENSITIPS
ncbi:Eukaryotic translation initiation factor [Salix suchowensis]|nr:Eukaryotic translation initiation factor [Salix suchowensis]